MTIFPNVKFFRFLQKALISGWKKNIYLNWSLLMPILQQICHFQLFWKNSRFLFEKTVFLLKKKQFLYVSRMLITSVTLYGNFAIIWWKKFTLRNESDIGTLSIGKKCKNTFTLSGWLSSLNINIFYYPCLKFFFTISLKGMHCFYPVEICIFWRHQRF